MVSLIEQVKDNVKISDLLSSRYNKRIDCPNCKKNKTASVINNEYVYCYSASCGFRADVIQLNSYISGLDYKESLRDLANRFNIKVNNKLSDEDIQKYEFHKEVNKCFIFDLNELSLKYLNNRGLTKPIIDNTCIGYANGYSLRGDFSRSDLIKYGFIKDNREFFINRVMFPLISIDGNIESFVGRYIGEINEFIPRYKNLQTNINTLILEQYLTLYNKTNLLCIAEGFIDTISLYQLGLQSVGILGVQGLLKYIIKLKDFTNICFCFDSDKDDTDTYKSYKALIPQIVEYILLHPLNNYYIYLPDKAKDINDLLCKNLITKELVENNKVNFIDFLVDLYIKDYSNHILLIKLIEVTKDDNNRKKLYDYVGKEAYQYAVSILDFYDRRF